jgi:hypothetical protein
MRESGKNHRKGAGTQITNFYVAILFAFRAYAATY